MKSLRSKIVALFLATSAMLFVVLFMELDADLGAHFDELEHQQLFRLGELASAVLDSKLTALKVKATDWAAWDDAYRFAKDRNSQFIKSNLEPASLVSVKSHYIGFFDTAGKVIYQQFVDFRSEKSIPIPQSLNDFFRSNSSVFRFVNEQDSNSGMIFAGNDFYLFAALPILTSDRRGPIRGTVVFARRLDAEMIDDFSSLLGKKVERIPSGALPLAKLIPDDDKDVFVTHPEPSLESTFGYVRKADYTGNHYLVLRLTFPREVYASYRTTRKSIFNLLIIVSVVFFLLFLVPSELLIFRRLREMRRALDTMTQEDEVLTALEVPNEDELSVVARAFNHLLSDIQHTQAQLLRARDEANQANDAKSHFLANITHELRTPLTGVIGMNSLLLDSGLKQDQLELVQTADASARHLLSLINEILDFSQLEARKMKVRLLDFSLLELFEGVVEMLHPLAEEKGLELLPDVPDSFAVTVNADMEHLRQVTINLVGNALKFTSSGGVYISGELLDAEGESKRVRVIVEDTGIGIPSEKIETIFEKFTQLNSSSTRAVGGTGLGLSVCRELVTLMGGTIGLESVVGKGTRFWFEVPVRMANEQPLLDAEVIFPLTNKSCILITQHERFSKFFETRLFECGAVAVFCFSSLQELTAKNISLTDETLLFYEVGGQSPAELKSTQTVFDQQGFPQRNWFYVCGRTQARPLAAMCCGKDQILTNPVTLRRLRESLSMYFQEKGVRQRQEKNSSIESVTVEGAKRQRLLVAEDNAINQRVIRRLLEKLGYEADIVENGKSVLEALEKGSYAIILMDCHMPVMDGFVATKAIRESGKTYATIPIVALTALGSEQDKQKCKDVGMNEHLGKPIGIRELSQVLDQFREI